MKIRVADYIAGYLAEHNIKDVFTVVGGGAMYLNDAFGHSSKLQCTYYHHEQAAAMAAEAYARIHNQMAAVCVTTGPGGTNAITGVLCGYTDAIPMLVISGQVRYTTSVRSTDLSLRIMGIQECDITRCVAPLTKYAVMITDPLEIKYHLERAIYLATHGKPGPVWLDIPLDVQGAMIEIKDLAEYDREEDCDQVPKEISEDVIQKIIDRIVVSKRPVLLVGNGVRLAGAHEAFIKLVERMGIPVVTTMSSIDAIDSLNPLYVGRTGSTGDRAGNFAVQNSDLLLCIGNRLGFTQTGFNYGTWAREAYTIVNDIDEEELKKPNIHVDLPVCADAAELIDKLYQKLEGIQLHVPEQWKRQCLKWKERYPVVLERHYQDQGVTNIYAFYKELTSVLQEDEIMVVSVGTARVAGSQASIIKKGQRFITNPSTASMGYGLPAAIGACIANDRKSLVMVTGEGSLQMNIQELQTIVHNKLPIKIFVINNGGYHSIRMTQNNFFGKPLVGVGPESGDISFPELDKIACAYEIPYYSCNDSSGLSEVIREVYGQKGYAICEIFVSTNQITEPKTSSKKLEDGRMVSAPLEDMYPFLSSEELQENMYIPMI